MNHKEPGRGIQLHPSGQVSPLLPLSNPSFFSRNLFLKDRSNDQQHANGLIVSSVVLRTQSSRSAFIYFLVSLTAYFTFSSLKKKLKLNSRTQSTRSLFRSACFVIMCPAPSSPLAFSSVALFHGVGNSPSISLWKTFGKHLSFHPLSTFKKKPFQPFQKLNVRNAFACLNHFSCNS